MMARKPEVPSITSAPRSLAEDQRDRTRHYLIAMSIRVVCFIGAFLSTGPLRWILVTGAVFLPYIAVVSANAGRANSADNGNPLEFLALQAQHDPPEGALPTEPQSSTINDETGAPAETEPAPDSPASHHDAPEPPGGGQPTTHES